MAAFKNQQECYLSLGTLVIIAAKKSLRSYTQPRILDCILQLVRKQKPIHGFPNSGESTSAWYSNFSTGDSVFALVVSHRVVVYLALNKFSCLKVDPSCCLPAEPDKFCPKFTGEVDIDEAFNLVLPNVSFLDSLLLDDGTVLCYNQNSVNCIFIMIYFIFSTSPRPPPKPEEYLIPKTLPA